MRGVTGPFRAVSTVLTSLRNGAHSASASVRMVAHTAARHAPAGSAVDHFVQSYGYWGVGGFVAIESLGVPFPGETTLVTAGIFAGETHQLSVILLVVAAACGAIIGDNIGFFVGATGGYRLLRRYGKYIRFNESRIKLGHYVFYKHGGSVVFFGRFVSVLRTYAAFLAGVNQMPWRRFLVFNAAGGILWASLYGFGSYYAGDSLKRASTTFEYVAIPVAVLAIIGVIFFLKRNERRLEAKAEAMFPGPVDELRKATFRREKGHPQDDPAGAARGA